MSKGLAVSEPTTTVVGSRPYPWPYDGIVDPSTTALVVVVGRGLSDAEALSAFEGIAVVARQMRMTDMKIYWVACSLEGKQLDLLTDAATADDVTVECSTQNGFIGSELDLTLRVAGVSHLAVAGFPTELAVHSTIRRANDLGYECLLLEDGCVAADSTLQRSAQSMIEMSGGIFGAVGSSQHLIAALQKHKTKLTSN